MRQEPTPEVESSAYGPTAEPTPAKPSEGNTRRGLLVGAGLAGAAGVLAACGGSDDGGDGGGGGGGGAAGAALARATDIPVAGGKVFKDEEVVVTQPQKGTFKAFSAKCTHRGCDVGSVSDGTINCPCHGSKFKIADGSVVDGPATEPLATKKISVQGGEITLA